MTGDLFDVAYGAADGASIGGSREFALSLQPNGRRLWLDFQNGPAPCVGCRRTFGPIDVSAALGAVFHSNVIDPASGLEAPAGLRASTRAIALHAPGNGCCTPRRRSAMLVSACCRQGSYHERRARRDALRLVVNEQ